MGRRYFKWLGFSLFVLFWGMSGSQAQKVVYRDYGRLGWTILDSLKRRGNFFVQGDEYVKAGVSNVGGGHAGGYEGLSCRETGIEAGGDCREEAGECVDDVQVFACHDTSGGD